MDDGAAVQMLEREREVSHDGRGERLIDDAPFVEELLAVGGETLHDEVEPVGVLEGEEDGHHERRGAEEEHLALGVQPVHPSALLIDHLHREDVAGLPFAHEPDGGVRAPLDLPLHLEVGEGRRLALCERIGTRLEDCRRLQLARPLPRVLERGELAHAGGAHVGPDGRGRRRHHRRRAQLVQARRERREQRDRHKDVTRREDLARVALDGDVAVLLACSTLSALTNRRQ